MGKKVTMKDIAVKLGLSINAPKYMSTYSSKNICVLLRSIYFRDMHFYSKILIGIEQEARKLGYDLLINFYEDEFEVPNCVENKRVAGIVIVGKIQDHYLIELKSYQIPVVLVDHTSFTESTDSILTDNKLNIFKQVKEVQELPEVFVCSNDNAAIQLCSALKIIGYQVPEDIGVVGFDDIDLSSMITPKITTIRVNKELMGKKAIQRLVWRIANPKEPVENIIMNVDIVERESVKQ